MKKRKISPYDIILYPLRTESAFGLIEKENKLVFICPKSSTKHQIKWAIQKLYNTKVTKVNTLITNTGKKKAYIRLEKPEEASNIAVELGIF